MLQNTTTYKLKASKSSRDLNDYLDSKNEGNISEEDQENNTTRSISSKLHNDNESTTYRSSSQPGGGGTFAPRENRFNKPRNKSYEYRSSRGVPSDRRGGSGGSGGGSGNNSWRGSSSSNNTRGYSFRKYETDSSEIGQGNYFSGRKFQEPLNKQQHLSSSDTNSKSSLYHSKYYDSEKQQKCDYGLNFLEDTRISKLIRRLTQETDQEKSLGLCKKLLDALLVPDNARYVRRAFSMLVEALYEVLMFGSGQPTKHEAARVLGRVAYVMESDIRRFFDWQFHHKYPASNEDMKVLLISSLKETLTLEKQNSKLQEFATDLMQQLQTILETTDVPDIFMETMDVVLLLEDIYPDILNVHFRDTVDILLGWHVDNNQTVIVTEFASKSLVKLSKYWQTNVSFSLNLMNQFLEDMEPYSEQLYNRTGIDDGSVSTDEILERITSLIRAFNTVVKCLGDKFHPVNSPDVTTNFIVDCLCKVLKTTSEALESYVPDNLAISANECIFLLLNILQSKASTVNEQLYNLIDLELSLIQDFSDATLVSMLLMISKIIKELSTNLPIELVSKIVGPTSELLKLRFSQSEHVQNAVVEVYHSLLNLKNIPLLQEAYRCVLGDLEQAYKLIVPNVESFCQNNPFPVHTCTGLEAELTCLFLLRCLSLLANATSSIIGMWALRPSILELLTLKLEPYNAELGTKMPSLQYSIFYLLYSHSRCYNHFVSSSNLVTSPETKANVIDKLGLPGTLNIDDVSTSSPSSGNLTIILNILTKSLRTEINLETLLLILNWLQEILSHSKIYLNTLCRTTQFKEISQALIESGYNCEIPVALAVYSNLKILLSYPRVPWNSSFLFAVNNLCILHVNSTNECIRETYANLLALLPWYITIHNCCKIPTVYRLKHTGDISNYNNHTVEIAQHFHMKRSQLGELLQLQFKKFTSYLLKGIKHEENWLKDTFNCCSPLEVPDIHFDITDFRALALNSRTLLHFWLTWESALLCVNNKLRTPLGKPMDTFMSIETALKQLAKNAIGIANDNETSQLPYIQEKTRVCLLLEFMEHLEKVIYNASDGCAEVLIAPSKPVRTFFHTNASTCREWMTRIRLPVVTIALHAGHSTTAIRNAQAKLRDLVNAEKTQDIEFERTVISLAKALLNLNEFEALQGLYEWSSKVSNRNMSWLKAVSDQANRKYETAINEYLTIFKDHVPKTTDLEEGGSSSSTSIDNNENIYLMKFMSNQITNCYKNLSSWKDIIEWQQTESNYVAEKNNTNTDLVDYEFAKIAYAFEEGDMSFLEELCDWTNFHTQEKCGKWGTENLLKETELNNFKIALQLKMTDNNDALNKLNDNLQIIQCNVQECLRSLPSEYIQDFLLLQHITVGLINVIESQPGCVFDVVSDIKKLKDVNTSILSKVLLWSEYFKNIDEVVSPSALLNIRINIIKRARKEGNSNFALNQINKYLQIQRDYFGINEVNGNPHSSLDNVAQFLIQSNNKLDKNIWSLENAKAVREIVKALYGADGKKNVALNVCAAASAGISQQVNLSGNAELKEHGSKLIITLAKWIQKENDQQLVKEVNSPLGRLIMVLPDIGLCDNREANVIPTLDMAAGKLLQFGVRQYPKSTKIWSAFGEWCYLWGKNALSNGIQLTDNDRLYIQANVPAGITPEELQQIYDILSQSKIIPDKDDIINNDMNMSERIENQLETVPILSNGFPEHKRNLVQVWTQAQKRIYHYYELSAEAFFQALQLCTDCETIQKGTECLTITATLRLLRFIVKHAMELQTVLNQGLSTTPTHPWKAIIPQLFSRLNHPQEYVRLRVSELLCRIAEVAPHLIIFPAVVGAVEGGHKFDLSDITMPKDYLTHTEHTELGDIEDEYDDNSENEESRDVLHSCFMSMVDTLSKQAPETITQVQSFVNELRRVSLLWDELWVSTLVQHHAEITKRLTQLEAEITKTENNMSLTNDEKDQLIAEKHRIIIKPIVFILEQLHAITSREPETPHEVAFQERYLELINDVLEKLKSPENPHKPQESWQPLKTLQVKLQQRAHKRVSFALKMTEISPILANMRDTVIAMPGLARNAIKKVTILSISLQVNVLPTKTKPKKLFFHGSDGHTYTYLFKGMEDLHLDERIMQFLTIANTMMAKSSDKTNHNVYRARHYSVIPLGLRSGLIRWVDGTTPMFSLYKRWQLREAAMTNMKQTSNNTAVVLRPSELFYNKLNPLLKEHGVKNTENRKEWPLVALKQVLTELMAETPNDLLARELWCRSVNAGAWWQVTKNYSYSVAVMSMIGYIIGLGDRHLDNVLIDLTSGEVIHIDYNVCFEKGKQLRVPEKVPFRMTPNMEAALGITGVEGMFRLACETVLSTMQKGRETLLTLLEAFVYDPLVDWTPGAEGLAGAVLRTVAPSVVTRQARRDLEREVTACMFHVRCAEMQADWVTNRDDIISQISTIIEELHKWNQEEKKVKHAEDNLLELHQQMTLIKEAEYVGRNHTLYTLPKRFTLYQQTQSCLQNARKALEEKITEYENHLSAHSNAMSALRGSQLSQWVEELNFPLEHENHKIFDIIKDFLQNAGQTTMINQCEQLETEVTQLAQQQLLYIRTCLDLLSQYSTVAGLYPASYLEKHRSKCYIKWCKHLLDTKSVDSCMDVISEYNTLFQLETVNNPLTQQVVAFSYQLQSLLNETNIRLQKSFERLNTEGIPDSGSRLDKAYNETCTGITNFLRTEKGANEAFECVNITALCALNKRYLTMEAAAASAGDYLVDLTSRDGDWFLDEMHLMSSLVTELSNLIPVKTDETRIPVIINCLGTANNIYKGLQELNFNFHTIILPETVKTIQTEEVTVLAMINDLNNIILNIGCPLPEVLSQLERHLRFTVMKMDSPHESVQTLISELRKKFDALLQSQPSEPLTAGQMLLMGFNGLFDKLQEESNRLITSLSTLETPTCWKKVDQLREAKALAAPVFCEQTRQVLDDIFLLKRVQTMTEFFSLCGQMCRGFKGIGMATVYDDDRLSKPIRRFTADYVSRQLLGVTSQTIALTLCLLLQRIGINVTDEIEQRDVGAENKVPLEDLCRKAVDLNLKRGLFTGNILAQASGLCSNLESTWRKREVARYMQQKLEIQRSTMERLQLQLTAHHWLHEDVIMLQPGLAALSPLMRSTFLLDLRKTCSALLAMQGRLTEAREQQKTLIASAEQRLKWAAGANPDLNNIMAQFECAVNIMEDRLNVEQKLAVIIGNTCNTLLHHEALRTRTTEAVSHDSLFVTLVKNWESSCRMLMGCTEEVSLTEASLIKIMSFDGKIDQNWIKAASAKLSELILDSQKSNTEQKENLMKLFDTIKTDFTQLKTLLGTHHKLFGDVRNLLKTMSKLEDCSTELHRFLKKYVKYLDLFSSVTAKFTKEQQDTERDMIKTIDELNTLNQQTNEIYDQVLNLEEENNSRNQKSRPRLIRQESVWMSPRKGVPVKKTKQKEQRNAYAIAVWHKVRLKLEGRDPDLGVKYSLQEQVDHVIKEATSLENLALLYEGWTPWV